MTAEILEQYRDLKREIQMLENSIKRLTEQAFHPVSDSVSGSMLEYPYIKRVVKITGMDEMAMERLERRKVRLMERREKARQEAEAIEEWVETIPDSHMRQIISMRFVEGYQWRRVAHCLGGGNTEDGVRMAFARFMDKSESCSVCSVLP